MRSPPPRDDAAPLAGGAGVNRSNDDEMVSKNEQACEEDWPSVRPFGEATPPQPPIEAGWPVGTEAVREYVISLAEATQVPVDFTTMLVFPVLAVALAQAVEIRPAPSWPPEVIAIWVMAFGDSGERKSAALGGLTEPIAAWEREQALLMGPQIAEAEVRRKVGERRLDELVRKAGRPDPEGEEDGEAGNIAQAIGLAREGLTAVPAAPVLMLDEPTTEGLAKALQAGGERALVASAEADCLDIAAGRYNRGQANWGAWLKAHSGEPLRMVRATRSDLHLARPVLSVAVVVQPDAVAALMGDRQANGRGVLARFLYACPRGMIGRREINPEPVSATLRRAYEATLRAFLAFERGGDGGPVILEFSPAAQACFDRFRQDNEIRLADAGDLADRRAWGSKLPGAIARIAAILHCIQQVRLGAVKVQALDRLIDLPTVQAAIAWAEYLAGMQRIAAGIASLDTDEVVARKVLGWLRRNDKTWFRQSECYHQNRGQWVARPDDILGALALLEDHGYIRRWEQPPPGQSKSGRPPSPTYKVSMRWILDGWP